jgi:Arc/MetJ-type ribon-helix-helix transcriptional regulator
MAIINITLPDKMRDDLNDFIEEHKYSSISECIRDLIRNREKMFGKGEA